MKVILFACTILFFTACTKETIDTAEVNINIYGPSLQSFYYKVKVNNEQQDSTFMHKGGYARHWFGYRPNNNVYSVFFVKQEKYDTGYVDFIWRNGANNILNTSRFYMDTLTFEFESNVKF